MVRPGMPPQGATNDQSEVATNGEGTTVVGRLTWHPGMIVTSVKVRNDAKHGNISQDIDEKE